jgi:hypothetical protein
MTTFKEYFLTEYAKKENALQSRLVSLKSGPNGKSFDRVHMRKNPGTVRKEYIPKHTIPNGVVSGPQLIKLLQSYKIDFAPGKTKHLGNSSSTVQMYTGDDGVQYGKVSTLNK